MWDIILTFRLAKLGLPIMYGLAVDDAHDYHKNSRPKSNPGRGWVMVLTRTLTAEALIDAREAGQIYASSGVTLRRIEVTEQELTVEVEPVDGETYTIDFIGTRTRFDSTSEPVIDEQGKNLHTTRRYSEEVGATLNSAQANQATYRFVGDEIYVRARVTSSAPHPNPSEPGDRKQAWIQPVVVQE